jgi:hypothetical protein
VRLDALREIADAVLYEGYVLWPYQRSALKNTRRFTFGGVYPRDHGARHPDDPWHMRTECLVERGGQAAARGEDAAVDVTVRFLHLVRRQLYRDGEPVDELTVAGERHLSWEEASERELSVANGHTEIAIPAGRVEDELADGAAAVRSWRGLAGAVEVRAERIRPGLQRLSVEISNTTPFAGGTREEALERTFCSTHTILRARGGAFVSCTDPPEALRAEVDACRNEGTWPVLVGEPGERHTMLSSPIILEEYPRVAPESPGDLFDGGEIDQLLTLGILSLTDEEKAEMRASDPRVREILERTEALSEEELIRLHGAIRELRVVRP